jgi:3-isopropylmalate/(R)-2-methylmalate dehydratase small subunit
MERRIKGKVWKFGDNVDTDQIIPAEYLVTGDPEELAQHAFEKVRPEFIKKVAAGDIIVADANFGCGSSREHAPRALIGVGVSCVIAKSFARIFYRNSINIGLPVIECAVRANDGDEFEIDIANGAIKNLTGGVEYAFSAYSEFVTTLVDKGGLIAYTKEKLKSRQ